MFLNRKILTFSFSEAPEKKSAAQRNFGCIRTKILILSKVLKAIVEIFHSLKLWENNMLALCLIKSFYPLFLNRKILTFSFSEAPEKSRRLKEISVAFGQKF
ncbi:hypothetical protein AFK68_03815 [Hydrocoleum sp. CS-953]|nr:hypothetical protein AFK68_03815 [Hydrocoleum sp. CS-953]